MLEPTTNADPLANTLFGNPGAPATPAVTTAVPQMPVQQPAVTQSEGDAPLPGHRSFAVPSNRSHVQEAIVIPLQQPQQGQPQQVQPQQQPLQLPVQQQPQNPQQLQLPGFPPVQQTAQPGQPIPGTQQIVDPAQNPQQQGHQVPVGAMLEERRRAQAANDALAAMQAQVREAQATNQQLMQMVQAMVSGQNPQQQQQEQIIDPEVDLPGHLAQMQRHTQRMIQEGINQVRREHQAVQEARINDELNRSQAAAEGQFGREMVAAAYQAVKANNMGQHFIGKGANAYQEMVNWYQGQLTLQQMGSNPAAYVQNLTQQIRAQVLAELRGNAALPSNIPPSVAGATSAQSSHTVVAPTNDFFQHMFTRPTGQQQHPRAA